jgi:tetratricopeptide (TPR) repeat protein
MRRRVPAFVLLSPMLMCAAAPSAHGSTADRWVEARSTHFIVLTDSSEKNARHLADQFERMRTIFHTLLPTPGDDSDPPVVVLAVKDRKGLQALEPEAYLAKNKMDLAGFFLRTPEKNYVLVRLDALEEHAFSPVYHEYVHYMLRKADNWLPLWMNEGLAQFYETTEIDEKTAWLGEANVEQLRLLNRNDLLPMATLLTVDAKSPYYHDEEKGSIFYAESWALTHYLIVSDRIQGTHRMHDYSDRLVQGEDSVTAAQHVFGDLGKLQAGLTEYIMQRKFMYFMMPVEIGAKDAAVEVRPVSMAEADGLRADVLAHTGRVKEARTLLDAVLRDNPGSLLAHETMGYVRYVEGDIEGARKSYGEAVALDSGSYLAHFYYASMTMHVVSGGEDEAIESSLQQAIRLNPGFAPAYDALAMFYASRHRKLYEAHTLNLRAVELEPGQLSFRLNCAEVLAEERQFADALGVLQSAMRLARTQEEVEAVESRVARVERSDSARAAAPARVRDEGGAGQ